MNAMEVATLRRTVDDMEARLRALEEGIAGSPDPLRSLGLTNSESLVLGALLRRDSCSREFLMSVLYGNRDEAPVPKCLDVFVCKIRKKLGLTIKMSRAAKYGGPETGGYFLTAEDRVILRQRLAA